MYRKHVKMFLLLALALSCLTFSTAGAQTQLAQWNAQPQPDERDREREERRNEEWQRNRDRQQQERHDEEWQRHHQRYFGGTPIQPNPEEGRENYRSRVHAQCNVAWDQSVRRCNTIGNAYQRQACVANSNNELNECKANY